MPANTTGILRYNAHNLALPTTVNGSYPLKCSDEDYDKLKPILPWTVGKPSNERTLGILLAPVLLHRS